MHNKISKMPKEWPLARKGKKYIVVSSHESSRSIPIVFAVRDMLKIAKTRREVKNICLEKQVKINGKIRTDEAFPLQPRDILTLEKIGKNYVLLQKGKKFIIEEVTGSASKTKIVKILNRKILAKDKIQANLQGGENIILKDSFSCGDSLVMDLDKNKVLKIIPLKKDTRVEVIRGKHISSLGKIVGIKEEGKKHSYEIKLEDGRNVFLDRKTILAIE